MNKRGFTIFLAVLVSSLALAVGLAIYDLLVRELALSQTATQSQYAIYASDSGAECALYWASKYTPTNGDTNAFATSSAYVGAPSGSSVLCNGQDISTLWGTPVSNATAATTTFQLPLSGAQNACAIVTVAKSGDPSKTVIVSRGFNTCGTTGMVRLERSLQISF